jgi:hypothetical protein
MHKPIVPREANAIEISKLGGNLTPVSEHTHQKHWPVMTSTKSWEDPRSEGQVTRSRMTKVP